MKHILPVEAVAFLIPFGVVTSVEYQGHEADLDRGPLMEAEGGGSYKFYGNLATGGTVVEIPTGASVSIEVTHAGEQLLVARDYLRGLK